MLTKLGWVLLGGKVDRGQTNVTLNHIKTDGLQKLVQKFWEIESYATLPKSSIKLLPKKDAHAIKYCELPHRKSKIDIELHCYEKSSYQKINA